VLFVVIFCITQSSDRTFKSNLQYLRILTLILPFLFLSSCSKVQPPAPQKPPFPIVTADNLFAVDCFDRQHVWAVGFNSVIVCTADGGKTWELQKSGVDNNLCDVSFVTQNIGWISGRTGIMLHTTDSGKSWAKQQTGVTNHLFSLKFVDESNGWATGDFGTIIHTSDGGATWVKQGSGEDKIYNDIFFVDRNNGWIVGETGLIYRTSDGGANWQLQECKDIIPVVDETQWETPTPSLYSVWFKDLSHGWASGMDSIVITTDDGGMTWNKVQNPAEHLKVTLYKIAAQGNSLWSVGQKGTYLHSSDSGTTWELLPDKMNTKFWLRDMDFSDDLHGWAVGSRGTIIKTEDGGKNWVMLSGIPVTYK
jgi:photosystem II stability/assembly factor-like uncharacterized protein